MGDIHTNPSLSIKRTYDIELLKSLIYHQDIVQTLLDRTVISIEEILTDPNKQHYVYYFNDFPIGIVSFLNFTHLEDSPNTYFVDIGVMKLYRGKIALELTRKMLDMFYLQNDVFRLLCIVKKTHAGCVFFCKKLGFRIIEKDDEYFLLEVKDEWCADGVVR